MTDLDVAIRAVRQGAQDCLCKGIVSGELLVRAIRFAVERCQILEQAAADSLHDELTGLYNRRGFLNLAPSLLETARRLKTDMAMIGLDLDGLKPINDGLGHEAGDQALQATAQVLRETFRESDVLARLGGDEFVVLAVGRSRENSERLLDRLTARLGHYNARADRRFLLSLSVGLVQFDWQRHPTLESLQSEADERMYEEKRHKRGRVNGRVELEPRTSGTTPLPD
jgi:diguanylate cyclase (GGDEF)-like protein